MSWDQWGGDGSSRTHQRPISRGIVLEGKYRLVEQIGRGGMGTVFRAVDEFLDREVAIKFLLPQYQADPSFTKRFGQEARALASVKHANVLEIYSFGTYGRTPFFVMEYVHGVTMAEVLEAGGREKRRILVQEALKVISQVCSGLAAVHRADAVHRDIKPANLMVQSNTRRIILMDFGLGQRAKPSDSKLDTWMPGGTPGYMAPELFLERQLDIWEAKLADIYSLGATAYMLLTGEYPIKGESWFELMRKHVKGEKPQPPSTYRPEIPRGLDAVFMRCLSKNPSLRYQRCEELQQALLPYVQAAQPPQEIIDEANGRDPETPPEKTEPQPQEEPEPQPQVIEHQRPHRKGSGYSFVSPEEANDRPVSSHRFPPDRPVGRLQPRDAPNGGRRRPPPRARGGDDFDESAFRSHPKYAKIRRAGVLVADPEPGFRTEVLVLAMELVPGCNFNAARTNSSALTLARKSPPAVMLASLHDPRLNGLELVGMVRGEERLRRTQVVLTADRITAHDRALLEQMGVVQTVLKNDEERSLARALIEAIGAALDA